MIQQINLYQQEFRVTRDRVSMALLAGITLLFLVLIASSFYQSSVINGLESELVARNNELKGLEQSYAALEKSSQPRAMDMNLAEQVEKIKRANEEKTRAKNYLSGDEAGNITGFSYLLQGLGRQRDKIEELWLKSIEFSDGGFDMRLAGSNHSPGLLPEFIQALNEEDLYRGREFREIKISRSTQDNKIMDFVLATRHAASEPETAGNNSRKTMFMARLKRIAGEQVTR